MKSSTFLLMACGIGFGSPALADDPSGLAALRAACTADAQKFCQGVEPGGGRIIACLKAHQDSLSDQCKAAAQAMSSSNRGSGNAVPVAPVAADTPLPAAGAPSPAPTAATGAAASKPAKHSAVAGHGPAPTAASYLRMKRVQIMAHIADDALAKGPVDFPAYTLLIPSAWDFKGNASGVPSDGCFADMFALSWEATSTDAAYRFQGAPNYSWQYADDPAELRKLNDPSRRQLGVQGKPCPVMKPMKADEYFHQQIAPKLLSGTQVIAIEPFPELNQLARRQLGLSANASSDAAGTQLEAIRAHTQLKTEEKSSESWITLVVVTRAFRQGRGAFFECHALDVMAFTAPAGKLDANDKLFKLMISSLQPEPKWQSYSAGFIAKAYQMEARKEAAMDQAVANFQTQVAETIMGVTARREHGSYNSAFAADQNIRGVQTFRDPKTGSTMELSNLYDHAWLNGSNEYIMTDDPNFNPNGQLSGDWNRLQPVRAPP